MTRHMKRLVFILALAVISINANADKQIKRAVNKAQQFAKENKISIEIPSEETLEPAPFYIFNAKNNGGFVIVSTADNSESVLAYSNKGNFNMDDLPANVRWWLDCYEQSLKCAEVKTFSSTRAPSDLPTVNPLISAKWGQNAPYNLKCPIIDDQQCVTGCVATAMAQIMKYYRYPESSKEVYSYRTNTAKIQMQALPAVTFDWDSMLDEYDASSSAASKEAVSLLMLYCGCAITMDYNTDGSGADVTPVCDAMPYYFDYDDTAQKIYRSDYDAESWDQMIYDCITKGIPVFYSGTDNQSKGHAFICDGFDKGFFHINWGWNGNFDGYFKLSVLYSGLESYDESENENGYAYNQMAVINLKPKNFIELSSIKSIPKKQKGQSKIYSISGKMIKNVSNRKHISKGIYIIDNKKVIFK